MIGVKFVFRSGLVGTRKLNDSIRRIATQAGGENVRYDVGTGSFYFTAWHGFKAHCWWAEFDTPSKAEEIGDLLVANFVAAIVETVKNRSIVWEYEDYVRLFVGGKQVEPKGDLLERGMRLAGIDYAASLIQEHDEWAASRPEEAEVE